MKVQTVSNPNIKTMNFHGIITVAPQMRELFEVLKRVAKTEATILLRGDSGTGKELVAHAIHRLSLRAENPFKAINCATLTGELLASELFGHVKGAFTGAVRDKVGLFQLADTGTLFLDEVAEMPLNIQAQFLRVIQDKTFTPVGAASSVRADVRVISATNKSLRKLVNDGRFREDLMYRIRVVPIFLPDLKHREGDIEALTWHFIEEYNARGLRQINKVESRVFDAFYEYPWPGNVRELRNNIEYAFAVGVGETLTYQELLPELRGEGPERIKMVTASDLERERYVSALTDAKGRKSKAAELLGVSRSTLWRKLRELGIEQ